MKHTLLLLVLAFRLIGADFYVSTTGNSGNSGAIGSPWSLAHALSDPAAVNPGDTIWVRGGAYNGFWVSSLTGTLASPIKVKAYPGERPTLDAGSNNVNEATIVVNGAYTWFQGLEITASDPVRISAQSGGGPTDIFRLDGFSVYGVGTKLINNVIHDTRQGISFWRPALDAELYGNIIYYSGWHGTDRGHGHGIYTQNETGTKHLLDNIIFAQHGFGIHAYGSSAVFLKGYEVTGNISFQNGQLSPYESGYQANILLGGSNVIDEVTATNNYTYFPPINVGKNNFGYEPGGGCSDFIVTGNYFVGGDNALELTSCAPSPMTGNLFDGDVNFEATYPTNSYFNTYRDEPPTGTTVFVRPNQYETGRAHITIFNWDSLSSVSVNLATGGLSVGAGYEIRDVQNFYGSPVASGTYAGGSVSIPMTGTTVSTPVGTVAVSPTHTLQPFGVFVLLQTSGGGGTGSQITGKTVLSGRHELN